MPLTMLPNKSLQHCQEQMIRAIIIHSLLPKWCILGHHRPRIVLGGIPPCTTYMQHNNDKENATLFIPDVCIILHSLEFLNQQTFSLGPNIAYIH